MRYRTGHLLLIAAVVAGAVVVAIVNASVCTAVDCIGGLSGSR